MAGGRIRQSGLAPPREVCPLELSRSTFGVVPLGGVPPAAADGQHGKSRGSQRLIDALPHAVGILDAAATLHYANRQWCAYTGVPVDDARSLPFAGLPVHPEDVEEATALFAEVRNT